MIINKINKKEQKRIKTNNRRKNLTNQGLCRNGCGNPLFNKNYCLDCSEKSKEKLALKKKEYISRGLCSQGDKRPLMAGKNFCHLCWAKNILTASRLAVKHRKKGYTPIKASPEELVNWYKLNLEKSNSCCNWCSKEVNELVIDHNHRTGKLRALICRYCNLLEGYELIRLENIRNILNKTNLPVYKPEIVTKFKSKFIKRRNTFSSILCNSKIMAEQNKTVPIKATVHELENWYNLKLKQYQDCCEWCHEPFNLDGDEKPYNKNAPRIHHNHVTGELVALLCHKCNVVEGFGLEHIQKVITAIYKFSEIG